jgi:hypothetical protein
MAILESDNKRYSVLRIASATTGTSGRLTISESQFIVGAALSDGSEQGYEAVRRLLSLADGNFALLDLGSQAPPDFDQALCLSIARILQRFPNLPAGPAELFDEKQLLDRVFGADTMSLQPAELGNVGPQQEAVAFYTPSGAMPPPPPLKSAWNFMQPLLNNAGLYGSAGPTQPFGPDDSGSHRTSLNRLRGTTAESSSPWYTVLLRDSLPTWQAMAIVVGILAVSLAVAFYFMQTDPFHRSLKAHNSITIQKNPKGQAATTNQSGNQPDANH